LTVPVAELGAATPKALAARTGVHPRTVARHWAAILAATGLVEGRRTIARGHATREDLVARVAPDE